MSDTPLVTGRDYASCSFLHLHAVLCHKAKPACVCSYVATLLKSRDRFNKTGGSEWLQLHKLLTGCDISDSYGVVSSVKLGGRPCKFVLDF